MAVKLEEYGGDVIVGRGSNCYRDRGYGLGCGAVGGALVGGGFGAAALKTTGTMTPTT